MKKTKREENPTSIRLPEKLKESLIKIGEKQSRSMSNLIVYICTEYVNNHKNDCIDGLNTV